jgi:hypothetical protein
LQILLDPFYRTIEGFFALVSKDWCSFGHKFEHRTNGPSYHKEHSPTFIQFLDGVFQIMLQYPAAFEYTSQFLCVFAQASYSGFFTSFRGNSEDERNSMMRRVAPLEDMALSEMQYSTVFCYMYLLLRSESYSSLLVNSFYQHPPAHCCSNLYLRIRTSVVDLTLWKEGLVGFNRQVYDVSFGPHVQNMAECIAVSTSAYARYSGYLDIHRNSLDECVRNRLDVIAACSSSQPRAAQPFYLSKLVQTVYRQSTTTSAQQMVTVGRPEQAQFGGDYEEDGDYATDNARNGATVRIQFWYRACHRSDRALSAWLVDGRSQTDIKSKGLRFALYCISLSEMKIAHNLTQSVSALKIGQIHSLIDEVVEEALIRCMRFEAAQRCILNEAAALGNGQPNPERRSAMDGSGYYYSSNGYSLGSGSAGPSEKSGQGGTSSGSNAGSSYSVTGGLKSMAAIASGALNMVADMSSSSSSSNSTRDTISAGNSSGSLDPSRPKDNRYSSSDGASSVRGSEYSRDSVASAGPGSPTSPSASTSSSGSGKKGITKKLFGYVGGMLGGGGGSDKDKDKNKDLNIEDLY